MDLEQFAARVNAQQTDSRSLDLDVSAWSYSDLYATKEIDSMTQFQSNILPPLPSEENIPINTSEENIPINTSDDVSKVIRRYISDGPLQADDLLDEIVGSTKGTCVSIEALRFIIQLELDPGGDLKAPEYQQTTGNRLKSAVCLTAKAMDIKQKYPLQASKLAQAALALTTDVEFPQSWIDDLNIIKNAEAPTQKPKADVGKKCNAILDSWQDIIEQDSEAPSVMKESILPMIGLQAVKESLIGMYRRFKLAQEQGDGAASSYNGKS